MPKTRPYSRAETRSDAIVHLTALALALPAVPVLIAFAAALRGDAQAVLITALYGVTLIAMITFSLLYNHLPRPDWQPILRRLDHTAIYFKIAGTVTHFALLTETSNTTLITVLWGAALAGAAIQLIKPPQSSAPGVVICLAMGWSVLVAGQDILMSLSPLIVSLMVLGGTLYTFGSGFLLAGRMRFHNTIWHGFVMVASAVFYAAILIHLIQSAS